MLLLWSHKTVGPVWLYMVAHLSYGQINYRAWQRPCMTHAWASYGAHKFFFTIFQTIKVSAEPVQDQQGWLETIHMTLCAYKLLALVGSCSVHHLSKLSGLGIPIWPHLFLMYGTHMNAQWVHGSHTQPAQAICWPWLARQIS